MHYSKCKIPVVANGREVNGPLLLPIFCRGFLVFAKLRRYTKFNALTANPQWELTETFYRKATMLNDPIIHSVELIAPKIEESRVEPAKLHFPFLLKIALLNLVFPTNSRLWCHYSVNGPIIWIMYDSQSRLMVRGGPGHFVTKEAPSIDCQFQNYFYFKLNFEFPRIWKWDDMFIVLLL